VYTCVRMCVCALKESHTHHQHCVNVKTEVERQNLLRSILLCFTDMEHDIDGTMIALCRALESITRRKKSRQRQGGVGEHKIQR